jgi:HK97 family phage major capsid protein
MKLTEALKKHMVEKFGVAANASDEDFRKAVSDKLGSGELSAVKFSELSADGGASPDPKKLIQDSINEALSPLAKSIGDLVTAIKSGPGGQPTAPVIPAPPAPPIPAPPAGGKDDKVDVAKLVQEGIAEAIKSGQIVAPGAPSTNEFMVRVAQASSEAGRVRVKGAIEMYDGTKSAAVYGDKCPLAHLRGQQARYLDRPVYHPSQQDKAVIGAFVKWSLGCSAGPNVPQNFRMTDHDKDLVMYALKNLAWSGHVGGDGDGYKGVPVDNRKLTDLEVKMVLDDALSGGVNAVPVVYDDTAIIAPLLTGELFPLITVIPLARGRVVHAFTIGNPTITTGTPEGTAIPLFDTTGFIGALDTTIYPAVGAIEIGLDFEEDSPANIGGIVIERYGVKHAEFLDNVIATGDGTTEPLGIFNTGGITTVASVNGAGGPLTISDVEGLLFGINKAFRQSRGGRNVFIMNETTYRRFRSIAVATGWNLRLFGTNYEDYSIMGYPVRLNATIPNNEIAFVNMAYYRMYRRQGLMVRVETGGKELALKNLKLIVVRALWGGRLELGGAGAIMTTAQS